jgi:hypothetical protein
LTTKLFQWQARQTLSLIAAIAAAAENNMLFLLLMLLLLHLRVLLE